MFQTTFVEKIKAHILCSVTIFQKNRAVYDIMWENVVERGRAQMTVWHMHAGYLRLQTHSEYAVLIVFPLQRWLHERASMLRYTYIGCIVRSNIVIICTTVNNGLSPFVFLFLYMR